MLNGTGCHNWIFSFTCWLTECAMLAGSEPRLAAARYVTWCVLCYVVCIMLHAVPAQKPISWASLAGKSASSSANQSSAAAVVSKPQATIKPERKAESSNVSQPLPQRLPRSVYGGRHHVNVSLQRVRIARNAERCTS